MIETDLLLVPLETLLVTCLFLWEDLARTQQKGGGSLGHQSILTFLCNHIKLDSPKKGGGRMSWGMGCNHPLTLWLESCD